MRTAGAFGSTSRTGTPAGTPIALWPSIIFKAPPTFRWAGPDDNTRFRRIVLKRIGGPKNQVQAGSQPLACLNEGFLDSDYVFIQMHTRLTLRYGCFSKYWP